MGQQPSAESQADGPDNPEVAWWCRLLARIVGTVGGLVAIITGVFTCLSVHPTCVIAGILQILAGAIVLVFEAPICCTFIEFTRPIASFADRRTFFQKAIIFGILAIPPVAMCFGLTTLFGCALMFASGVLYGLMALGKKADRAEMMSNAAMTTSASSSRQDSMKGNLIANEVGTPIESTR